MSTREMKEWIAIKLEQTEDEFLLREVYDLLSVQAVPDKDESKEPVYRLSDAQRASIIKGLEDVATGRISSDEEAETELDKWFKEEDKKWGGK